MLKINGTSILLTRGDECTITLKVTPIEIEGYIFKQGDIVTFSVYNRKGLENKPVLLKEITVENDTNIVDISLTSQETKIGEIVNKPIDYWYEIQLNYSQTILGYDDKGPKLFTLYPEGADL